MNKLYVLKSPTLLIAALILVAACGSDDPKPSVTEQQLQTLTGTWKVNSNSRITRDGKPLAEWDVFTLTIAKGTYTAANTPRAAVWPALGTWQFLNNDPKAILRDDDIVLGVNATSTSLELSFTISAEAGRSASTVGKYVFNLVK